MNQPATVGAARGTGSASPAQQDQHRGALPQRAEQREGTHAQPAADEPQTEAVRQVSIGSGLLSGSVAFVGGAVLAGAAHYAGSARGLREEGIDPRVRLKAIPMAFRALAVSTAMCGVLGALGLGAMHIGLQVQPVADVSSVADAIALARRQRAVLQGEFQSRLHPDAQRKL